MSPLNKKQAAIETRFKFANQVFIAFSGGLDSHVLLHLCAASRIIKHKITTIYINHGLQKESDSWALHCEEIAKNLSVAYQSISVDARPKTGESPEAAARQVRYEALGKLLEKDDVLLLGQHREDQLETFLLQLFRGAGLTGLAAMPEKAAIGKGQLFRPLLDVSQQEIKAYALEQHLNWIEDPSNLENDFDRNFLRNEIVPLLKTRWSSLDKTIFRSARHCAQAQQFINKQSKNLLLEAYSDQDLTLSITAIKKLDDYELMLVIRQWLQKLGQIMPSEQRLRQIVEEVIFVRQDSNPELKIGIYTIRKFNDKLVCLPKLPEIDTRESYVWQPGQSALDLKNNGNLRIIKAPSGISAEQWQNTAQIEIKYRQGGESIYLQGREGQHKLKKLFQEALIPPWEREKIPLLFLDGKLAIVGNNWISSEFYVAQGDCVTLLWLNDEVR